MPVSAVIKSGVLCGTILLYMIVCIPFFPVFYLSMQRYRKINAKIVSFFSKILLRLLNCRVTTSPHLENLKKNYLIVSNHLSYIDILILSSLFPGCFVTSVEIRNSPILGQITQLAGCLFVERRSRDFLMTETRAISDVMKNNMNVILFPEGTSTNGETVLRFRQPLFKSGMDAGRPVLPVSINYKYINCRKVTKTNRDLICWYGDMTFWNHFKKLADVSCMKAKVTLHPPLYPRQYGSPAELSKASHRAVTSSYFQNGPLC